MYFACKNYLDEIENSEIAQNIDKHSQSIQSFFPNDYVFNKENRRLKVPLQTNSEDDEIVKVPFSVELPKSRNF